MAASTIAQRRSPACLTWITRGEQDARRRHQPAPRLDRHRHAEALAHPLHQRAVGVRLGRGLVPVAHAEPAAEVDPCHRLAGRAQPLHQGDQPLEGGLEGREARELRADMHGEADRLDSRQRGGSRVECRNLPVVDAELVAAPAGGDLVVGLGIDVPDSRGARPAPARPWARAAASSASSSARRFHVELPDPVAERQVHLVPSLAGPGEDQPLRRHAGPGACRAARRPR